jgi:hypothetical protein
MESTSAVSMSTATEGRKYTKQISDRIDCGSLHQ